MRSRSPYYQQLRLWREDGPIIQEIKEMIEESKRTGVER
jgi:hypothetical protein